MDEIYIIYLWWNQGGNLEKLDSCLRGLWNRDAKWVATYLFIKSIFSFFLLLPFNAEWQSACFLIYQPYVKLLFLMQNDWKQICRSAIRCHLAGVVVFLRALQTTLLCLEWANKWINKNWGESGKSTANAHVKCMKARQRNSYRILAMVMGSRYLAIYLKPPKIQPQNPITVLLAYKQEPFWGRLAVLILGLSRTPTSCFQ